MKKRHSHLLIFLTLIAASVTAVTMVVLRAWYSGRVRYAFLVWNLILAWLPFLFAWVANRKPAVAVLYGPLWLLFFPNAPYIVTDLVHLGTGGAPLWYDAIMLFTFALIGLLLGFLSLYLMQSLVARRFGGLISWLFVITAVSLSGYGVYVGRFLRWNSWDVFTRPASLLADVLNSLVNPQVFPKTYTVSLSLSAVMLFAYVVMVTLPQLSLQQAD